MNQLYPTDFLRILMTEYQEFLNRYSDEDIPGKVASFKEDFGSDLDIYVKKVAKRWWLLREYLQMLEKIINVFATDYQNENEGETFEEMEWWHYNYENFLIRLSAILDQIGKLVNEVYEFNVREKFSNWNSAMNAVKNLNQDCADKIDEFQQYLEKIRLARHDIVHKGGYESEDIKAIDNYFFDEFEIQFFGEEWFNSMKEKKNEEKEQLRIRLGEILDESINYIKELFVIIEDDFQNKIDSKK